LKKLALFAVLAGILVAFSTGFAFAENEKVACSVCGYLIDKDDALTAEHEGNKFYFCDAGCKAYFMQNPAAFAAGKDMDPVCGMTVDKKGSIEAVFGGRQMHFCSEQCRDKYAANPAEYEINYDVVSNEVKPQKELKYTATYEGRPYAFASEENKAAFEKNPNAYVYAECPVTGKVFLRKDAGAKGEYEGKTYYFCCEKCLEKFNKNPKKYSAGHAMNESCGGAKDAKQMKAKGTTADAGCPAAKKAGGCPMEQECKGKKK